MAIYTFRKKIKTVVYRILELIFSEMVSLSKVKRKRENKLNTRIGIVQMQTLRISEGIESSWIGCITEDLNGTELEYQNLSLKKICQSTNQERLKSILL